jgi:hypothetical protein
LRSGILVPVAEINVRRPDGCNVLTIYTSAKRFQAEV